MITINGLNISDNTYYLVEEIDYRSMPDRIIDAQPISTRPGDKLITTEWGEKTITITGRAFSPTVSGILPIVDTLQQNMAVQSTSLIVDTGRTYTVSLAKMEIPTQFFNVNMVQYTATFQAVDPFAYASAVTISGIVAAGITTLSGIVTISGTVFAEPMITLTPTNGSTFAGDSGYSQFQITYKTTGEILTVSGSNSQNFQYGVPVVADYHNFLVTISGVTQDYSGVFSRWEPGIRNFEIKILSGTPNGYEWALSYQPRYFE